MKATKPIDIYLTQKRNVRVIDVVQYDTGIQLVFTVKDFTIPSGATATLYVQKPSGKFVYQEDGITVSGSTVTINLHNQAITEYGKVPYQVSLKSGSDVITTFTGLMMVEKSLKDSGATESKTVIRAFDEAVSDHVAEFQTKAEQIVQACIATLPDDYTTMEAKVNDLANAVKGYMSGAVVAADDVSPVEHELTVHARGVNLIPFPYYTPGGTINGITYTINDDGSITAKGTATSNAAFYLTYGLYGIKGTVFMSGCPAGGSISGADGGGYSLRMNKIVNGVEVTGGTDVGNGNKVNLNGESLRIYIVVLSGKTVDCTFRPMLNYGESAKDFVKSDLTSILVSRYGKNVLNLKNSSPSNCTISGNGIKANANGVYYCEMYANYLKSAVQNHDGKAMTFSVGNVANNSYFALVIMYTDGTYAQKSGKDKSVTLWLDHQGRTVQHVIVRPMAKSEPFTDTTTVIRNLMLEFSDTASDFESYSGEGYIPAADGTVSGMTSLSPNMTILTDTVGATVDCEYNRDTNKVIDKLINAITALGGTV